MRLNGMLWRLASYVALATMAMGAGAGCSGDDTEFACQDHSECLDDEACLGEVCEEAPEVGDSCPDDHEGMTYEEFACEDGQWGEVVDPPEITAVSADPPTVDPGEQSVLEVEASSELEELSYQWGAPDGWELAADDEATVDLTAIDEPGETATIEITVTDSSDQTDSGEVVVSTHEIDGPEIDGITADPEPVIPGEIQVVSVEVSHPDGLELDYDWSLPGGWELEETTGPGTIELRAADDHGQSGMLEVTVNDIYDRQATTSLTLSTESLFCGGEGTEGEPFEICAPWSLNRVGYYTEYLDDHFQVTEHLEMEELDEEIHVIGDSQQPFSGMFDGAGYEISGLEVDIDADEAGLFGRVDADGRISDVSLESVDVTGEDLVGGLVGRNEGTVSDVEATGNVEGLAEVGGLIGRNLGSIHRGAAEVDVVGEDEQVGGLVGFNPGTIESTTARGVVDGEDEAVGGLVGENLDSIVTSYATGDVEGDGIVGGLVGSNAEDGTISESYSVGSVTGSFSVGGLVGVNDGDETAIERSFWNLATSGQNDSAGGAGLSETDEFRFKREFESQGWTFYPDDDFDWIMRADDDGVLHPSLDWEAPCDPDEGESECNSGVCATDVELCVECDANPTDVDFGAGEGTEDEPWRICSSDQFKAMSDDDDVLDDHFELYDDIEGDSSTLLSDDVVGTGTDDGFDGVFDGREHRIVDFEIASDSSADSLGLFGTIEENGVVRDLELVDITMAASNHDEVGALAGRNEGTIEDCRGVEIARIEGGEWVGGLVGYNEGAITDVEFSTRSDDGQLAEIWVSQGGGGLVGFNGLDAQIEDASVDVQITGVNQELGIGGLAGVNYGSITDSNATGGVEANSSVGGLVGRVESTGEVQRSYSTAEVTSDSDAFVDVGGLVGASEGDVSDSFSIGEVEQLGVSSVVGGLIGHVSGTAETKHSYAATSMSVSGGQGGDDDEGDEGELEGDALIGGRGMGSTEQELYWDEDIHESGSTTGEGLTTDEFSDASNFLLWDFTDVWEIGEAPDGADRPVIQD